MPGLAIDQQRPCIGMLLGVAINAANANTMMANRRNGWRRVRIEWRTVCVIPVLRRRCVHVPAPSGVGREIQDIENTVLVSLPGESRTTYTDGARKNQFWRSRCPRACAP